MLKGAVQQGEMPKGANNDANTATASEHAHEAKADAKRGRCEGIIAFMNTVKQLQAWSY